MGKYVKRPVVIDAFQWFKNGDHPDDACVELTGSDGQPFMSEGKVVRYFRRPEPKYAGTVVHEECGYWWKEHGWIDTLEGGHTVCPGSFIITGVKGERYPCRADIFAETYAACSAPKVSAPTTTWKPDADIEEMLGAGVTLDSKRVRSKTGNVRDEVRHVLAALPDKSPVEDLRVIAEVARTVMSEMTVGERKATRWPVRQWDDDFWVEFRPTETFPAELRNELAPMTMSDSHGEPGASMVVIGALTGTIPGGFPDQSPVPALAPIVPQSVGHHVYDSYHQDGVPSIMPTAEAMEEDDRRLAERYNLPPDQVQRLAETRAAVLATRSKVAPVHGTLTDDPTDPALGRGVDTEQTAQHERYLVLSVEEREKGFVRPVRLTYVHTKCGVATSMGQAIAETYSRQPSFYGSTYCMGCRMHLPVGEFRWNDGSVVGS